MWWQNGGGGFFRARIGEKAQKAVRREGEERKGGAEIKGADRWRRVSIASHRSLVNCTPLMDSHRMMKQFLSERKKEKENKQSGNRERDCVPLTVIYSSMKGISTLVANESSSNSKMKPRTAVLCTLFIVFVQTVFSNPVSKGKFFFDGFPKGITISRVTTDTENPQQTTTGYSIRFVPLITLLAGLFPNLMTKLGQFSGVNKYVNTRRFDVADPLPNQNATEQLLEEEEFEDEEEDGESELIECDASHLGLWPDKSDSQRYYKCEVDPRTPPSANCIKDYFQGKHMDKGDVVPLERIEVPGVKPCFLLSMMKCANGFKYSHKTRICVPDIVFGSQP